MHYRVSKEVKMWLQQMTNGSSYWDAEGIIAMSKLMALTASLNGVNATNSSVCRVADNMWPSKDSMKLKKLKTNLLAFQVARINK